jgi:hypothetical protein
VVVDEQGNEDESKPLLWSERTSLLTKCLTEPTLLEMYENPVSRAESGHGIEEILPFCFAGIFPFDFVGGGQ